MYINPSDLPLLIKREVTNDPNSLDCIGIDLSENSLFDLRIYRFYKSNNSSQFLKPFSNESLTETRKYFRIVDHNKSLKDLLIDPYIKSEIPINITPKILEIDNLLSSHVEKKRLRLIQCGLRKENEAIFFKAYYSLRLFTSSLDKAGRIIPNQFTQDTLKSIYSHFLGKKKDLNNEKLSQSLARLNYYPSYLGLDIGNKEIIIKTYFEFQSQSSEYDDYCNPTLLVDLLNSIHFTESGQLFLEFVHENPDIFDLFFIKGIGISQVFPNYQEEIKFKYKIYLSYINPEQFRII